MWEGMFEKIKKIFSRDVLLGAFAASLLWMLYVVWITGQICERSI
jgi:hypothetical protein